jgi:hypothetical protein
VQPPRFGGKKRRDKEVSMLSPMLAALAAPVVTLPASVPNRVSCNPPITFAARDSLRPVPRKLGELPPANHYLAVVRHVDGCPAPAVVRSGIRR